MRTERTAGQRGKHWSEEVSGATNRENGAFRSGAGWNKVAWGAKVLLEGSAVQKKERRND